MSMRKEIAGRSYCRSRSVWLLAVLVVAALPLAAQNANRNESPAPSISDLGLDNLKRVAASPTAIEDVLRKEFGLMLELKRWAANDATQHGQVIVDSDLTDQGIFTRLESDIEFRSVATRLLERYGFLIPRVNPDSPEGKEQDLVLRGRAIQISRAEQQESQPAATGTDTTRARDSVAPGPPPPPPPSLDYSLPAGPRRNASPTPGESTTQAVFSEGPTLASAEDTNMLLTSLPNRSSADLTANYSNLETPDIRVGEAGSASSPNERPDYGPYSVTPTPQRPTTPRTGEPGQTRKTLAPGPLLVARTNPYPDIPSLYDMYLQASAHPGKLERFGENVFRDGTRDPALLPTDLPVGPDYVVGPGDSLVINLWGGVSQRLYRTVDHGGQVALPETGPLLVSGHTLGDVQQSVEQVLRTQFRDVSADVSLSRLRTIRVYVVGDVEHPGAYDINSLSTPLNALFAAGGPTAGGSLRLVREIRGKQPVQEVDVYDLLLHGVEGNLAALQNGDTVLVPPLGPQVTIEGAVRRPAIYELRNEKTLAEALALAGGILPTAALEHIEVERVVTHEKRTMLSLNVPVGADSASAADQLASFAIQDGDAIHIFPIAPYNADAVYVEGHVVRPGRYSYHAGMKLTDVVRSYNDLLPEPSTRYAEIIRLNPPDYKPSVESFDLASALANSASAPVLRPLDTVRIFSRYDFENPPAVTVGGEVRRPGTYRASGQIHLRDAIELAGGLTPQAEMQQAQVFRYQTDGTMIVTDADLRLAMSDNPLDNLLLGPRDRVLVHRNLTQVDPPTVYIRGEVAKPGRYPLAQDMRVGDLIRLGGGLKRSADSEMADLTDYQLKNTNTSTEMGEHHEINIATALAGSAADDLLLRDGDTLTIRQIPGWNDIGASVTIRGEVVHPGTYGIRPGERLSSVLERAGGFLPTAYPEGAVLERQEIRELQTKGRQDLIQRVEQDASTVKVSLNESASDQAALQQASMAQHQRVLEALRNAPDTGRLVVYLSSDLKRLTGSVDDPELRAGDTLSIPKRPGFVVVTGQIYNSNAVTFMPNKTAGWYLERAGGATNLANRKAIFIVRANGAVVKPSGSGWWTGGIFAARIQPGDVIVVPEKAVGSSAAWKNLLAIGQFAQAATFSALAARNL